MQITGKLCNITISVCMCEREIIQFLLLISIALQIRNGRFVKYLHTTQMRNFLLLTKSKLR